METILLNAHVSCIASIPDLNLEASDNNSCELLEEIQLKAKEITSETMYQQKLQKFLLNVKKRKCHARLKGKRKRCKMQTYLLTAYYAIA